MSADPHEWAEMMNCVCRWNTCANCRLCKCQAKTYRMTKTCGPRQPRGARTPVNR